ncbi:uncharacterized protein LOC105231469 isoform X2 [Bactrocera dorsalis]|uniref:Uncharacterized protein LOC105231469 isoform X2 n=1 Tax=Bactrocera dorsalis TaxID=27457 RepID=A0ABM3JYP3_BACDO|nr:uncharacterized protein LOC105231469 isoform X2 [Bactrocera dorsalis]
MIEVDPEITKTLANSAVLRAVEEEEQMKCDVACERQSRPRQRKPHPTASEYYEQYYDQVMHTPVHQQQLEQIKTQYLCHQHDITIDRDTVLKINRLATRRNLHKRDHSWPPPCSDYAMGAEAIAPSTKAEVAVGRGTQSLTHSRSSSREQQSHQLRHEQQLKQQQAKSSCTNNALHFAESVCKQHGIDAIREKFNSPTRIIEPTPTELRQRNKMEQLQFRKQKLQKNATNKSARVTDSSPETRTNISTDGVVGKAQQTLTNVYNNTANTSSVNAAADSLGSTITPNVAETTSWPAAIKNEARGGELTNIATTNSFDASHDYSTPVARGFSAPETKAADENIGLVEPRRYYFEQLARRDEGPPKKWHSYDNIVAATSDQQQITKESVATAAINNNRQSQSLDRGRAQQQRRREQLPPQKPRSAGGAASGGSSPAARITPVSSASEFNVTPLKSESRDFGDGRTDVAKPTVLTSHPSRSSEGMSPRVQRRAIKLATEIKICYDDLDTVQSFGSTAAHLDDNGGMASCNKRQIQTEATKAAKLQKNNGKNLPAEPVGIESVGDLEDIPLPTPPKVGNISSTNTKHMVCSNAAGLGSEPSIVVQRTQKQSSQTQKQQQQRRRCNSERIIPIELEKHDPTEYRAPLKEAPRRDLSTVSADQLYDDACIYLRSIDLDDRTVAYIPAAITIVPSPPEEMLQHAAADGHPQTLKAGIVTRTRKEQPPSVTARTASQTVATMPKTNTEKSTSMPGSSKQPTASEAINRKSNNKVRYNSGHKMNVPPTEPSEAQCKKSTRSDAPQLPTYNTSDIKFEAAQPKYQQKAMGKAHEIEVAKSNIQTAAGQQGQQRIRSNRPRGIYYTDGEYLYGPFGEIPDTFGTHITPTVTVATEEASRSAAATGDSKRNCADGNEWQINNKATKARQKEQQQNAACRNTINMQHARLPPTTTVEPTNEGPSRNSEVMEVSEAELQGKNAIEIAALETKYGRFQQSIAEHLRQIDTYMENAKAALNRSLPHPQQGHEHGAGKTSHPKVGRQSSPQTTKTQPEQSQLLDQRGVEATLAPESPLHTIARQWLPHRPLHIVSDTDDNLHEMEALAHPAVLENMPVVEQALQDLSAIKVDGTAANLTDKYAGDLGSRNGDDGSVLQPLMRRLIAVQSKQPSAALPDHAVTLKDRKDIEGLLLIEHHIAPTACLAKRVTILETLDDGAVPPRRKPSNFVLIGIEEGNKEYNVSDEIGAVNDKIDDSNNCKRSADKSSNDIAEPKEVPTMAKMSADNGNVQVNITNTVDVDENQQPPSDTSGRFGHKINSKLGAKSTSTFDISSTGEVSNEHVIDVVGNYEQLMQLQQGMMPAAGPKATAVTKSKQTQTQRPQFQEVSLNRPDVSATKTTPVPRRRATTLTGEKPTICTIGARAAFTVSAGEGASEQHKTVTSRWQNESLRRQQRQQQQLSETSQTPTPPIPPPLPPLTRAGSLPKDLCKSVVSGYISTHQSQEQLVGQVIDKLQVDVALQRDCEQLRQAEPENADNNESVAAIAIETSNQDRLRDPLVQQRQPTEEFAMQQLNQQQSAILPITKSNQKPCDQQNAQSTEITIPSSRINAHSAEATRAAQGTAAATASQMAAQKVVTDESTITGLASEGLHKRTIAGRRGKLTVHINADNKNCLESDSTDGFDTYKATYEIPSPCFKQQIIWKQTVNVPQIKDTKFATASELGRHGEDNNNMHFDAKAGDEATASNQSLTAKLQFVKQQSRTPSPAALKTRLQPPTATRCSRSRSKSPCSTQANRSPTRKYPAALIEPNAPTRAASPFGLNPLDITDLIDDTTHAYGDNGVELSKRTSSAQLGDTKFASSPATCRQLAEFVPQVEGHNVGLLVRASVDPQSQQQWERKVRSVPQTIAAQCNEKAQIEMDNALTHSAATHYADADTSDDDVDYCVDERQQHIADGDKHSIKGPTPTVSLTPSPSLAYCARAGSWQPTMSERVHDACRNETVTTPTWSLAGSSVADSNATAVGMGESVSLPARQRGHRHESRQQEVVQDNDSRQQSLDTVGEPTVATPRESGIINRSFDNVSPRPYISVEGYKRVAWPPVSEERVVREFTPQPTSGHYPVSGSIQQQQGQQQPPQHLQQQQQPLQQQQQQQPAAPANQAIIYNNVSRGVRDSTSHPNIQPQQYQQSQQQPIQYTQAQFNRQPSHEPAGSPYGQHLNDQYGQQKSVSHYPTHNYPIEQQQPEQQYEPNASSGWRPIHPPVPKARSEFLANSVGDTPFYPSRGQQYPSTPQYRATSYDQYQAPPQAQKYQPHQGSQPPYAQQPYSQPQQQQQPSWAHNQPAPQYQPVQAPYQQGPPQQQYQAAPPSNYQSQAYHQTPQQQQPQQYSTVPQSNQYNSYPQPQHVGQDQPDHQAQSLPQDYRGGSPGIITLRKEAPVTQKPAPVYNAQPAAVSFQGGSNMRGDLKWPPPEYKEAAIRENEERRQLALGPVCRPRKVNRDYTTFFAKNALNSYYPSYKIPPGTQHMFA